MRTLFTGLCFTGCLSLLLLASSGCSGGDGLHPVRGKVMHNDKPLAGALVSFHPKDNKDLKVEPATGLTKEDGTFTLSTGQKEGAREGEYVVTIICSVVPQQSKKGVKAFGTGQIEAVDILKGAYANVANSKIHVTVKSGDNDLVPFDLK